VIAGPDIAVPAGTAMIGLPGYAGASTDGTAAAAFMSGNNGGASASAPNPSVGTTNGTTNGFFGACPP
jgi:hypothetical protein